jgi:hypothetical protein
MGFSVPSTLAFSVDPRLDCICPSNWISVLNILGFHDYSSCGIPVLIHCWISVLIHFEI